MTLLDRRSFLFIGMASLSTLPFHARACSPWTFVRQPSCSPAPDREYLVKVASLLASVPRGASLIEIAEQLAAWDTSRGLEDSPCSVWDGTRTNPIIPWFFNWTDMSPCNDKEMNWCAAFMAWAVARSGRQPTLAADVAGWIAANQPRLRELGEARRGDIVMLRKKTKAGSIQHHIALFLSSKDTKKGADLKIIGGNQRRYKHERRRVCIVNRLVDESCLPPLFLRPEDLCANATISRDPMLNTDGTRLVFA